jgi:hypothetical protein
VEIYQVEEVHPAEVYLEAAEEVLLRELKIIIMISGRKSQTSMVMILLNSLRHLEMTVRTSSGNMVMMR